MDCAQCFENVDYIYMRSFYNKLLSLYLVNPEFEFIQTLIS